MISRGERVPERSPRGLGTGVLLGILFGAANAYLGLRVGMTVSASIPAAVMSVALFGAGREHSRFRPAWRRGKIGELPKETPMRFARRRLTRLLAALVAAIALAPLAARAGTPTLPPPTYPHGIAHLGQFIEQCPTLDPAIALIRADFDLRRNGVPIGEVACSEPISALPIAQYTDALIALQTLRIAYYMDWGQIGHLPWTFGSLYPWLKSKVQGIDIRSDSGYSYCCETIAGKLFFVFKAQDEFNRDFDRTWQGLSGDLDLFVHEARHVDGFPHSSCCGIPGGCDDVFDVHSLSPYGTQWWLNAMWLTGGINVGVGCLTPSEQADIVGWHQSALDQFRSRFCTGAPGRLATPSQPGGPCTGPATSPCIPGATTLCLNDGRFKVEVAWQTSKAAGPGRAVSLTADTGYLWFFASANVEMVVKLLNGCGVNGHYWTFLAGLTSVDVTTRVTDTESGVVKTYLNPPNTAFKPVQDTSAFLCR